MYVESTRAGAIRFPVVHPDIAIATSGEKLGNTDPRFGDFEEVRQARASLHGALPKLAETFVIKPQAADDLVDVDQGPDPRINNSGLFKEHAVTADALITRRNRVGLLLGTADCVPLVLAQPDRNILSLIHLGWKGAALGLQDRVIDYAISEMGFEPAKSVAYLGPSIQSKSYVTQELGALQRDNPDWDPHVNEQDDGWHVDVPGFVVAAIQRRGVAEGNISQSAVDTGLAHDRHFSYTRVRQDAAINGRNGLLAALV